MTQTLSKYNKENPFVTSLLENYTLNKAGSSKDTRHFTISLDSEDMAYKPGDALYVYPENEASLVHELLDLIELEQDRDSEFEKFTKEVNLTRPSNKLFKLIESKIQQKELLENAAEKFNGFSVPAIIKNIKASESSLILSSSEIVENSSKLQARAYSIASSLRAHPNEVHLCIARVEEELNGQKVFGVCSNYLSKRVDLNQKNLRVYLHINDKFRLPSDSTQDIIMVGPGTGIAPFRAFIEERNWQRDQGMNVGQDWLFFGDQRAAYDFLYQEELEAYSKKYNLKISTAFSRDQAEKVYVQNKMLEESKTIFDKLENGAYFYVCGDARRMAKDVDLALQQIITENGKNAEEYIKNLKDTQRYCRDVY